MTSKQLWFLLIIFLASSHLLAKPQPPSATPWLRLEYEPANLKINRKADLIAFTRTDGKGLSIVRTASREIIPITRHFVGQSFFWAPDSQRLFFRELVRTRDGQVRSQLQAYDCSGNRTVKLEGYPHKTGTLTYTPQDMRMSLLHANGLHVKQIYLPNERLAKWQVAVREQHGRWAVSDKAVFWMDNAGISLTRLKDDQSGISSFAISPDGQFFAWSTSHGNLYVSENGGSSRILGEGREPNWHPDKPIIAFSAPRKVGPTITDYDLKLIDLSGEARFLTVSQFSRERWPIWHPLGKHIIYGKSRTTDLYLLSIE